MEHFTPVQAWLINSYNIKVSADWLTACLEWITQENEGQALGVDVVRQQVFEQWLTSDLAEIGEPSLPVAVQTNEKMELVSNYALQILSIVDVGFPLYGQQQKLTGRENINAEVSAEKPFQPAWEPKQSRMLLLSLTDGYTDIKAMEYQPIRSLHSQLPSGTKCMLSGTVLSRQGMVLLTEEHIQLLGGEVDTLVEANTPLAILQQNMAKSREDEGRHARQTFSGKFVTRGSNNKLDVQKRHIVMKEEKPGSSSQRISQQSSGFRQAGVRREIKSATSTIAQVKTEVKNEQNRSGCGAAQRNHQGIEEEWGEDINYSELFEDDMDFNSDVSAGQKEDFRERKGKSSNWSKIFPVVSNTALASRQHTGKNTNHCSATISVQKTELAKNYSFPEEDDLGVFDDDMEMGEVFESSSPSGKWNFQLQPTHQIKSNNLVTIPALCDQETKQNFDLLKPNSVFPKSGSQESKSFSPQIPYQHDVTTEVKPESKSPTFTSPVNVASSKPASLPKIKPLFKVGQPVTDTVTSSSPAKKQKIQAKVTNLFCKQPTAVAKNNCEKPVESHVGVEGSVLKALRNEPQTSISASEASSLGKAKRFSSTPLLSPTNQGTLIATEGDHKRSQEVKDVPRAVIQPFQPATNDTSLVCEDSSPFKHLTDLDSCGLASLTLQVSIVTLIEKLCSNNGSHWSLACKINDGVTNLDVDISNAVLTGLIGFSAEDSIAMRQRFKSEPQVKEVFAESLSQCQSKLISGRNGCSVELKPASCNSKGKRPIIVKLSLQPR